MLILVLCIVTFRSFSTVTAQSRMQLIVLNGECNLIPFLALGKSGICGNDSWRDPDGAQVGIETKILEFDENFSFNAGLSVSLQGAAWEEVEMSGRESLPYLNVPLLLNYRGQNGFYGEVGLQPGILLSAKDKYDGGSFDYKNFVVNLVL